MMEARASPPASHRATRVRRLSGAWPMSASVSIRYLGAGPGPAVARATPWLTAASLPVQPAARGEAASTSSLSARPEASAAARAAAEVPSVEPSSTSTTRNAPG